MQVDQWFLFRKPYKIHLNDDGLSSQEQMKIVSEVYNRYYSEERTRITLHLRGTMVQH